MAEAPHPSSPEEMPTEAFSMKRSRLCPRADMWMLCPGKLFSNREKEMGQTWFDGLAVDARQLFCLFLDG